VGKTPGFRLKKLLEPRSLVFCCILTPKPTDQILKTQRAFASEFSWSTTRTGMPHVDGIVWNRIGQLGEPQGQAANAQMLMGLNQSEELN
jgi:hypothetical protein